MSRIAVIEIHTNPIATAIVNRVLTRMKRVITTIPGWGKRKIDGKSTWAKDMMGSKSNKGIFTGKE